MLISHCNVKSWEIAITSGDSGNMQDSLDGSVIFVTTLALVGICTACLRQHVLRPHCSAEVTGSVGPSHLWVLSAIAFVKGFTGGTKWNEPNWDGVKGGALHAGAESNLSPEAKTHCESM